MRFVWCLAPCVILLQCLTNLLQKIKQIGYRILLVTGWWEAFFGDHFGDGSSLKGFVFDGAKLLENSRNSRKSGRKTWLSTMNLSKSGKTLFWGLSKYGKTLFWGCDQVGKFSKQ
jgi:hypothetical protein